MTTLLESNANRRCGRRVGGIAIGGGNFDGGGAGAAIGASSAGNGGDAAITGGAMDSGIGSNGEASGLGAACVKHKNDIAEETRPDFKLTHYRNVASLATFGRARIDGRISRVRLQLASSGAEHRDGAKPGACSAIGSCDRR